MPIIKPKKPPIIELLVLIVNENVEEKTIKLLNNLDIDLQLLSQGMGTADSMLSEYFGVTQSEKSIFFALIKLKDSPKILDILNKKLNLDTKNTGIAFTIPIKSAMYSLIEKMGFTY